MRQPLAIPTGHAVWGTALVCCPGPVLTAVAGQPVGRPELLILRVLGARHLAQAAVSAAVPSRAVLRAGAVVDLLHAASCVGLALAEPRWRRAAGLGGLSASAFAAAGLAIARGAGRRSRHAT